MKLFRTKPKLKAVIQHEMCGTLNDIPKSKNFYKYDQMVSCDVMCKLQVASTLIVVAAKGVTHVVSFKMTKKAWQL